VKAPKRDGVLAPEAVMEARGIGTAAGHGGFSTSGGHGGIAHQTAAMMEVGRIQMTVTARAKQYFKNETINRR